MPEQSEININGMGGEVDDQPVTRMIVLPINLTIFGSRTFLAKSTQLRLCLKVYCIENCKDFLLSLKYTVQ